MQLLLLIWKITTIVETVEQNNHSNTVKTLEATTQTNTFETVVQPYSVENVEQHTQSNTVENIHEHTQTNPVENIHENAQTNSVENIDEQTETNSVENIDEQTQTNTVENHKQIKSLQNTDEETTDRRFDASIEPLRFSTSRSLESANNTHIPSNTNSTNSSVSCTIGASLATNSLATSITICDSNCSNLTATSLLAVTMSTPDRISKVTKKVKKGLCYNELFGSSKSNSEARSSASNKRKRISFRTSIIFTENEQLVLNDPAFLLEDVLKNTISEETRELLPILSSYRVTLLISPDEWGKCLSILLKAQGYKQKEELSIEDKAFVSSFCMHESGSTFTEKEEFFLLLCILFGEPLGRSQCFFIRITKRGKDSTNTAFKKITKGGASEE